MNVRIELKARPCPGVERAVSLAEDVLRHGGTLYSIGELIHNRREIDRLKKMGLCDIDLETLLSLCGKTESNMAHFLVRTHGESEEVLSKAKDCQFHIVDATCPIVKHSQDLVVQHVREGWGIIIAGDERHAEVQGLMARTRGNGSIVSTLAEAKKFELEDRSLLIAQTTIDSQFFKDVIKVLSKKHSGIKVVDTTCRFLQKRQKDVAQFCQENDVLILVGGSNSSNCRLLHKAAKAVNDKSYHIEEPEKIETEWINGHDRIGISGGASTPKWQLKEMKSFIDNYSKEKNPKGLKHRKGGKYLWWMWKNQS